MATQTENNTGRVLVGLLIVAFTIISLFGMIIYSNLQHVVKLV